MLNVGDMFRERKSSPKFFRPKFFRGRLGGMSVPECLFFPHLEGLTEVFGRMSAGTSGRKLPLWADFSFLNVCLSVLALVIFKSPIRADFREGDEDSNFSVFRVRRFSEWPEPLPFL